MHCRFWNRQYKNRLGSIVKGVLFPFGRIVAYPLFFFFKICSFIYYCATVIPATAADICTAIADYLFSTFKLSENPISLSHSEFKTALELIKNDTDKANAELIKILYDNKVPSEFWPDEQKNKINTDWQKLVDKVNSD